MRTLVTWLGCGGGGDDDSPFLGADAGGDHDAAAPGSDGSSVDHLRVFVSSQQYPANLVEAGGGATAHESADALCQLLGDAAQLGGTWRAWLSTTDIDAIDHIEGDGPWYRMDGTLLFPNHASLGVVPDAAILIDENGEQPDPFYEAWTGTAVGGRVVPLGDLDSTTCLDWSSTIDSDEIKGIVGDIDVDTDSWTNLADGFCSPFSRRLYCFEQ